MIYLQWFSFFIQNGSSCPRARAQWMDWICWWFHIGLFCGETRRRELNSPKFIPKCETNIARIEKSIPRKTIWFFLLSLSCVQPIAVFSVFIEKSIWNSSEHYFVKNNEHYRWHRFQKLLFATTFAWTWMIWRCVLFLLFLLSTFMLVFLWLFLLCVISCMCLCDWKRQSEIDKDRQRERETESETERWAYPVIKTARV